MSLLLLLAQRKKIFTECMGGLCDILDTADEDKIPGRPGGRVDLDSLNSAAWLHSFRYVASILLLLKLLADSLLSFTRSEVEQLVVALDLPEQVVCENGVQEDARTALAMLLRRLAYPARIYDLYQAFGWERSRFSRVTRTLASYIYLRWRHLLHFDTQRLTPESLQNMPMLFIEKVQCLTPAGGLLTEHYGELLDRHAINGLSTMDGSESTHSSFIQSSLPTGFTPIFLGQLRVVDTIGHCIEKATLHNCSKCTRTLQMDPPCVSTAIQRTVSHHILYTHLEAPAYLKTSIASTHR